MIQDMINSEKKLSRSCVFKLKILANFEFWGHQICQQTVHKKFRRHFHLKSKRERMTLKQQK